VSPHVSNSIAILVFGAIVMMGIVRGADCVADFSSSSKEATCIRECAVTAEPLGDERPAVLTKCLEICLPPSVSYMPTPEVPMGE